LSALLLFLAWGLGLNLTLGRFVRPSQGAVDNGAACAAMLGLAERLAREPGLLRRTRVTLALFAGEEVNMQGSRAYVRDRAWPVPAAAVNLEILAQDGDYVFWEQDGSVFKLTPTAPEVNALVTAAVTQATGQAPCPAGPVNSDCGSFLAAGIPATTLGTRDRRLGFGGLHGPADNLGRIVMARLPEAVEILAGLVALSRLAKPADEQRRGERPDGRGGEQGRV
jgi:Zn-dependent M28 family amino/carboxypeptidase